jgi:hypothetical protein
MEKMPGIVRSRLARKTPEQSAHPDANLLAAFAERTLLERERAAVIAHLVECVDCRECVALACATAEPEMPLAAGHVAGAGFGEWFRQWRWILSSATACCVVATALLRVGEPPARVITVGVSSRAAEPQIVSTLKNQPAVPVPLTLARKKNVEAPPSNKTQTPALMTAKKEVALEAVLTQPPAPQPPAETALTVSRLEAPKADAISSFVDQERGAAVAPDQTPSPSAAKRFGGQAALAGRAPGFGPRLRASEPTKLALKPVAESSRVLWSINASPDKAGTARGVVERSMDSGQSWQAVPLSERVSFRSVASVGADVWVGGSEGALFHSSDSGGHWEQIQIADEGGKLSGEVIRIDVRDPSLVTVATSTREVWVSADGKQWVRK